MVLEALLSNHQKSRGTDQEKRENADEKGRLSCPGQDFEEQGFLLLKGFVSKDEPKPQNEKQICIDPSCRATRRLIVITLDFYRT